MPIPFIDPSAYDSYAKAYDTPKILPQPASSADKPKTDADTQPTKDAAKQTLDSDQSKE